MSTNTNKDKVAVKSCTNSCKFKYKIRWFNSKGAGLILLWTILVGASSWYSYNQGIAILSGLIKKKSDTNLTWVHPLIVSAIICISVPLLGWLADTKLGLYKVFKTGIIFLLVASVLASVLVLVLENLQENSIVAPITNGVVAPFIYFFGSIGAAACFITCLQLDMDQMPDASSTNITSYIVWFVFCAFAGIWLMEVSYYVLFKYSLCNESFIMFDNDKMFVYNCSRCTTFRQTFSLFPVVCMTVVLCSDFFFAKKWLIIEPNSTQSLKLNFRVLKFAAKHKAPINRSALTYWEDDLPSRIDLGKSRYGGPFTTEQVEDVKTFFKLVVVTLFMSYFLILLSRKMIGVQHHTKVGYDSSWYYFTYNKNWCVLIGTLVYEFAIYPLFKNRLPNLLKSIGVVSIIIIVLSIVSLSLSVAEHFDRTLDIHIWNYVILQVIAGFLEMFSLSVSLQFVCAQSPYKMRILVMGLAQIILYSTTSIGYYLNIVIAIKIPPQYYPIVLNSLTTSLSIVAFVVHCLLARWYKGRVRDDIYTPHRLVEEVYERYLSHQTPED